MRNGLRIDTSNRECKMKGAIILLPLGGIVTAIVLLSVFSCGPSPQDYAEATVIANQPGATMTAAAPSAYATATAVAIEGHIKEATEDEETAFWENVWWWGAICACVLLVVGTVVVSKFAYKTGGAAEKATQKKLELAASVIHVNKNTKTFPVLVDWEKGRILNLETGERVDIRSLAPPDARLIAISHRVREVGLYTDAAVKIAGKSKSPQPSDMLPSVAASIPVLNETEVNHE
jgi:hypothetical protein